MPSRIDLSGNQVVPLPVNGYSRYLTLRWHASYEANIGSNRVRTWHIGRHVGDLAWRPLDSAWCSPFIIRDEFTVNWPLRREFTHD
jgi:hypothetical protein